MAYDHIDFRHIYTLLKVGVAILITILGIILNIIM